MHRRRPRIGRPPIDSADDRPGRRLVRADDPRGCVRPARADRCPAPRWADGRRPRSRDLDVDARRRLDARRDARHRRGGDRRPCGADHAPVRDDRAVDRPDRRQLALPEPRPGRPSARDRLDLDRSSLPADGRQQRGEAPDARACLRRPRLPAGRVQDRRVERQSRAAIPGSARPSKASSAGTWSWPAAARATPPTTASSTTSGQTSRTGCGPGWIATSRRLS